MPVKHIPSYLESVESTSQEESMRESVALGERAAQVGFDWPTASEALGKVREETEEVQELLDGAEAPEQALLEGEVGDLLFAVCMVARLAGVDPVRALASTNAKFRTRFAYIERELVRRGVAIEEATLEEMEEIWQASKHAPLP